MSPGKSFDRKKSLHSRTAGKVQSYCISSCNETGKWKVISSQNTEEELFQNHSWVRKKSYMLDWNRAFSLHQSEILVQWKGIEKTFVNLRMV